MIHSICIVRLSALGDVLMLVPLVRTLQAAFPMAKITWVISRPGYDLVEGMEGVEFVVIEKPNSLADYWRFRQLMRARQFDVLLATQASFRANLLYPLIRATRKIGYDRARAKDAHSWFVQEQVEGGREHTVDGFLKFARALGVDTPQIEWALPIGESERQWAKTHLPTAGNGPLLVINPAASKPERSWLPERYVAIIQEAQTRWGARVVLTGGPGAQDRALANVILSQVDAVDLVGKTKPKQLLAVIQQADLVLCPDTGPSHMATAVGTPVIALHAVTNPDISGPYLYRDWVVNQYPVAVARVSKKSGRAVPWGTQAHGQEAMRLVSVEHVLQQLGLFMSSCWAS